MSGARDTGTTFRRAIGPEILLIVVLFLLPVVAPAVGGGYDLITRILIWGVIGMGFDLLFGFTGLLSFGQSAFFGTGGFVTAYLLTSGTISSAWLGLVIGTVFASLVGLLVGFFALRRIGIYFAMITIAFAELAFFLENSPLAHWTGGENGIPGVPGPQIGFGAHAIKITSGPSMYWLIAGIFFLGFVLARRIVHSPVGMVMLAIRENTARTEAVGHDVARYKLAVFMIAAAYAGLAGGLLGIFQSYMPPDTFALSTSGEIVVQTVIGGVGTLVGPAFGAAIWLTLRTVLQSVPSLANFWLLILGAVFVLLVTFLRQGVFGAIRQGFVALRRRGVFGGITLAEGARDGEVQHVPRVTAIELPLAAPKPPPSEIALEAKGIVKRYGGLTAVDNVSLSIPVGALHAVIGPNGAGKSTLFKMLACEVTPTEGQVLFHGRGITGIGATAACQMGIAKSYQINQLFPDLTVRQNLRVAVLARRRGKFRLDMIRNAASIDVVEAQIESLMAGIGLDHRADLPVAVLAYGEKRRLEIGLALASGPSVLLLDEPLAGMSPEERSETKALIRTMREGRTLVIVEHDMDAIFELADRITVLANGRLLTEGTVEDIQNSREVQAAYLGGMAIHELA